MADIKRNFNADRTLCDAATVEWTNYVNFTETDLVMEYDRLTEDACDLIATCERIEDARFIAEARTGWPAALDEIERLRAERDAWKEAARSEFAEIFADLVADRAALLECVKFYAENNRNTLVERYGRHARECIAKLGGGAK